MHWKTCLPMFVLLSPLPAAAQDGVFDMGVIGMNGAIDQATRQARSQARGGGRARTRVASRAAVNRMSMSQKYAIARARCGVVRDEQVRGRLTAKSRRDLPLCAKLDTLIAAGYGMGSVRVRTR